MEYVPRRIILPTIVFVLFLYGGNFPSYGGEVINPLRFDEDKRSWQITAKVSRYLFQTEQLSWKPTGLWKEERDWQETTLYLETRLDLTNRVALVGRVGFRQARVRKVKVNVGWSTLQKSETSSVSSNEGSFSLQYDFYHRSDVRLYLLIPIMGRSPGFGAMWSTDPVIISPKLNLVEGGFEILTGVSFVANEELAFTGGISFSWVEEDNLLGLNFSVVYRKGPYKGIQLGGSIIKADVVEFGVQVGLTYGGEAAS